MEKKSYEISRRSFLKGAAAGALGLAAAGGAGGLLTGCAASGGVSFARNVDVVIAGAGLAGMSAAYEAASAGASVLIIEKSDKAGGTSALSGGVVQASSTAAQKELTQYKDDSVDKHFQLWLRAGEGFVDEALVKDLAYGAPSHIDFLVNTIGLTVSGLYGHAPIPYIDPSLFADRIHEFGGGAVITEGMAKAVEGKGVKFDFNSSVDKVLTNDAGEVIGVAATINGKQENIKANKCVILCCSSIDWNVDMARDLSPQHYFDITTQICACAKTNTGDGIRMGQEVGAALAGFSGCIDINAATYAGVSNQAKLLPGFMVNKAGMRYVREDATYAFNCRASYQNEAMMAAPTWMIFGGGSFVEGAPWTQETAEAQVKEGKLFKGETIEALAAAIGVDAKGLADSLALWNATGGAGNDTLYGRNTGLAPVTAPFYASRNMNMNLGAIGGLKINTDAQVLSGLGNPIPRLYAAGLNSGGWIGPYYPGSGTALMGCLHYGRKAGVNAAKLTAQK